MFQLFPYSMLIKLIEKCIAYELILNKLNAYKLKINKKIKKGRTSIELRGSEGKKQAQWLLVQF